MDEDDRTIVNFEAHRPSAEADARVRCPRCGRLIFMHDVRCQHCGVHFEGEAWQFSPSTRMSQLLPGRWWRRWAIVAILAATLAAVLLAYR